MDGGSDLQTSAKDAPRGKGVPWRPVILVGMLAALAGVAYFLPVGRWLEAFRQWIEGLGFWAPCPAPRPRARRQVNGCFTAWAWPRQ